MFLASQSTRSGGKYSIQTNKGKKKVLLSELRCVQEYYLVDEYVRKKSSEKSEHKTKCLLQSYLKMIIEILKP